jgi:predicted transcriptional regulator
LGKRASGAEIEQIKNLVSEHLTNREIALKVGRTESAIRNIRFREGLKASTQNQLPFLIKDRDQIKREISQLTERRNQLSINVSGLRFRREELSKALQIDKATLQDRLSKALLDLKQKRPDLFIISGEEQIAKLMGLLADTLLKYLFA